MVMIKNHQKIKKYVAFCIKWVYYEYINKQHTIFLQRGQNIMTTNEMKKMIETMMNCKANDENCNYKFHVKKMYGNKIIITWDYGTTFIIKMENENFDGNEIKKIYWYDELIDEIETGKYEKHGITFVGNDKYLCDCKTIDEKFLHSFIYNMVYNICNRY